MGSLYNTDHFWYNVDVNEALLLLTAVVSTGFIIVSSKFGTKENLHGSIVIFLILISTVGGKIVEFFGYETNTGNIFYASIFLATYFLIERHGRHEGSRSLWTGVVGLVSFLILIKITLLLTGSEVTSQLNQALSAAFVPTTRIAAASILAFILSQSLNIYIFVTLKEKFEGKYLWLRANVSNALSQILDSLIFFTLAFFGVASIASVLEIILVSLTIKIVYMMVASTAIYLNRIEFGNRHDDYSTITIR